MCQLRSDVTFCDWTIGHAMATVQLLNDSSKNEQKYNFGQAVFAILRKIKREATPPTSQPKVASHLLLPQRTKTDNPN